MQDFFSIKLMQDFNSVIKNLETHFTYYNYIKEERERERDFMTKIICGNNILDNKV